MFNQQLKDSILFITLDSCRYDTFASAHIPHLKSIGPLYRAQAPGNFTYSSHSAMFVGFTPGIAEKPEPFINPKYGKIFKIVGAGLAGKGTEYMTLQGRNIIEGLKARGYYTIGTGSVGWFDPDMETGKHLTADFDKFYYAHNTYSLAKQLKWIENEVEQLKQPVFIFINIGETHVPYYFEGADWSKEDNPCIPFSNNNDVIKCKVRQKASLEFVDRLIAPLLKSFEQSTIIACADHGDCWGEDGLWEHGISHEKVLEVPFLFRLAI